MNKRVGVLGGTFDPIHDAHLALAHAALTALALDEVLFVPAGQPWQKQSQGPGAVSPAVHRQAMTQLAIADTPHFTLDSRELQRSGPTFTLDTLRELAAQWPTHEWVLIIGADQYAQLHTWRDWRTLLGLCTLAVANRPSARPGAQGQAAPEVQAFAHRVVPLPMLDISSTDIRQRVKAGADISALVPPQVARYIETHRLYQDTARS
jgi:nicotinate-nucleotide adenylyltransferase